MRYMIIRWLWADEGYMMTPKHMPKAKAAGMWPKCKCHVIQDFTQKQSVDKVSYSCHRLTLISLWKDF